MSNVSKVIWSEGTFLRPHHFQQQERYVEHYVEGRCSAIQAYGWGLKGLQINHQLLTLGKVALSKVCGVFPDGTPFSVPDRDDIELVIDIPPNTHNQILYLGIPLRRQGAIEVLPSNVKGGAARYRSVEFQTQDTASEMGEVSTIDVGRLDMKLLLESDDLSGYACIGITRIIERRDDKQILLDENYLPSCVDITVSGYLKSFLSELSGLLFHRSEALSNRMAGGRAGTAEIADYLLLQLINRIAPLVDHLSSLNGLHPERLFTELVQMSGELATFSSSDKRLPQFPPYLHEHLQETFEPVIKLLRAQLSMVIEQNAVSLELVERKYGIRIATIADRDLVRNAQFVVAVKADINTDSLRGQFPNHVKIGSVERIRELVNAQMPGITLSALPVAPRQIPYHAGFAYFELDRNSEYWHELQRSGGIALHIGADLPGLELEFWAIRR